jgi:hypothetical protein
MPMMHIPHLVPGQFNGGVPGSSVPVPDMMSMLRMQNMAAAMYPGFFNTASMALPPGQGDNANSR